MCAGYYEDCTVGKLIGISVGAAVKTEDAFWGLIGSCREDRYVLSAGRRYEVFRDEIAVARCKFDRRAVGCSSGGVHLDAGAQRQVHFGDVLFQILDEVGVAFEATRSIGIKGLAGE